MTQEKLLELKEKVTNAEDLLSKVGIMLGKRQIIEEGTQIGVKICFYNTGEDVYIDCTDSQQKQVGGRVIKEILSALDDEIAYLNDKFENL